MLKIEAHIAGIPCLIGVTAFPSDDDGGEWTILDRKGRPAPWLERKIDALEEGRIEDAMDRYMAAERRDAEEARAELRWYARHGY